MAKFKFGETVYINKKESNWFNDIATVYQVLPSTVAEPMYVLADFKYGTPIDEYFKEYELEQYIGQNVY